MATFLKNMNVRFLSIFPSAGFLSEDKDLVFVGPTQAVSRTFFFLLVFTPQFVISGSVNNQRRNERLEKSVGAPGRFPGPDPDPAAYSVTSSTRCNAVCPGCPACETRKP